MDGAANADGDRVLLAATLLVLGLLGAAIGVWGAFLIPLQLFGHACGLADLIGVGGIFAAGYLGARGCGLGLAAVAPGIGWIVAIALLGSSSGDEVVIPSNVGNAPGVGVVGDIYLASGFVGMLLAALLAAQALRRVAAPATGR